MKTKFLFPNRFKKIGWIILVPSAILGFFCVFYDFTFSFLELPVLSIFSDNLNFLGSSDSQYIFALITDNVTDEIAGVLFIVGALFVAFSKEKQEDEFIEKTRLESLVWATYVNYIILIVCMIFFYSMTFLMVMIINMFTILIFFIIRFQYILYITKKSMGHEK